MLTQILCLLLCVEAQAGCPFSSGKTGLKCPHELTTPPLKRTVDVTDAGCNCTSSCGATVDQELAKCDWCWTDSSCGRSSERGTWDYCVYPGMKPFDLQDHVTKLAQLWANVTDPSVVNRSNPAKSAPATLVQMLGESMITAFDDQFEVLPTTRSKVIHVQGVHCQVNLAVPSTSPFTGILSPGNQSGVIRLGSATSLDDISHGGLNTIFPGYGIKFPRTGVRSASWVGLRTTGGGGSHDFFNSSFSNHVAPPPAFIALHKFQQASGCINMVGLSDACSHTQAGDKVVAPVFPFETSFTPTGLVHFPDQKKTNEELLHELATIPSGTALFDVSAFASPADKVAGKTTPLGTLSTTSECVQSIFGDSSLFFRHSRMEEDFALAPEWIPQMKALNDTICGATVGPVSNWQCVPVPK